MGARPKARERCKYFVLGKIICCLVGSRDIVVKKLGVWHYFLA